MINKYSGITLITLAIVSIVASWMIYSKYTKRFYVSLNNTNDSRQLIKDIAIKPEAFASLEIMKNVASKLSEKPVINENHLSIASSPLVNLEKRPLVTVPTDKEKRKRRVAAICRQARNLNVSMSFVSESEEYAVIAEKFVRKGQVIANKFKVLDIQADKIQVQKQGVKCDIKVNSARISQL